MPKRRSKRVEHRNPRQEESHRQEEPEENVGEEEPEILEEAEHARQDYSMPLRNMTIGNRNYTPLGVMGDVIIVREDEADNPLHRKIKIALSVLWLMTFMFMLAMGYYFFYGHLDRSNLTPLVPTTTPRPFAPGLQKILSRKYDDEEEF